MTLVVGLLCAAIATQAQGLFSVPSGEVLEPGVYSIDMALNSGCKLRSEDTLALSTFRVGVFKPLTLGYDFKYTGKNKGAPNFSLQLLKSSRWAIAGGYENVGVRSFGESPYMSVSHAYRYGHVHVGWMQDDMNELMLGTDVAICPWLTFQADHITGSGNFSTMGFQFQLSGSTAITIGYMHPNDPGTYSGLYLDLNIGGKLSIARDKKEK